MKWMKERDLLIAQTMAFVQSVTGKKPDADKLVATSAALAAPEAAGTPDTRTSFVPDLEAVLADTSAAVAPLKPVQIARPDFRDDFQSEIRGPRRQFPRPSGTLQPRARGLLQRHHGQGPRRAARRQRTIAAR